MSQKVLHACPVFGYHFQPYFTGNRHLRELYNHTPQTPAIISNLIPQKVGAVQNFYEDSVFRLFSAQNQTIKSSAAAETASAARQEAGS